MLHDGPPYANGDIHIGHAVNKILKDMIVKIAHRSRASTRPTCRAGTATACRSRTQIEKKYGRNLPREEMQAQTRAYATEQIAQQMADFKRLGVLGDWDHPYLTMDFAQRGRRDPRARRAASKRGFVYRGLKPVNWCFDCGSALAEAEVEYADRKRPGDRRRLPVRGAGQARRRRSACRRLPHEATAIAVIWTTTPWTMPANQALNLNPELDYALVDTERGCC